MPITNLYSADIFVHDLDRALSFYVDALGFETRVDEPMDDEGHRWVEIAPAESETSVVLAHDFGHWRADQVGGWSRMIFAIDDMTATAETLRANGVAFDQEPETAPWGTYAQVRDPDGNVIGLLEEPSGGGELEASQ